MSLRSDQREKEKQAEHAANAIIQTANNEQLSSSQKEQAMVRYLSSSPLPQPLPKDEDNPAMYRKVRRDLTVSKQYVNIKHSISFPQTRANIHPLVKTSDTFGSAYVFYPDLRLAGYVDDILDYIERVSGLKRTFLVGAKFRLILKAETISGKPFLTWATGPGSASVSLFASDATKILYNNSFDPFATPVPTSESLSGYKYSLRGEDDEIIRILYN